jgi:hypothetical protein
MHKIITFYLTTILGETKNPSFFLHPYTTQLPFLKDNYYYYKISYIFEKNTS